MAAKFAYHHTTKKVRRALQNNFKLHGHFQELKSRGPNFIQRKKRWSNMTFKFSAILEADM